MFNFLRKKPKAIITLKQLISAIESKAKELGQDYFQVSIGYAPHWYESESKSGTGVFLKGYIHNHGWHDALTIDELVSRFDKKENEESPITDMYVEEK